MPFNRSVLLAIDSGQSGRFASWRESQGFTWTTMQSWVGVH